MVWARKNQRKAQISIDFSPNYSSLLQLGISLEAPTGPHVRAIRILRDSKMGVGLGRFIHLFVSEIPRPTTGYGCIQYTTHSKWWGFQLPTSLNWWVELNAASTTVGVAPGGGTHWAFPENLRSDPEVGWTLGMGWDQVLSVEKYWVVDFWGNFLKRYRCCLYIIYIYIYSYLSIYKKKFINDRWRGISPSPHDMGGIS